jgi:A nuclease of the HNH/ENDO VII superfamily with conserved WHH
VAVARPGAQAALAAGGGAHAPSAAAGKAHLPPPPGRPVAAHVQASLRSSSLPPKPAAHVQAALRSPAAPPKPAAHLQAARWTSSSPAASAQRILTRHIPAQRLPGRGALQPSSRQYDELMKEAEAFMSAPSTSSTSTPTSKAAKGVPSGYVTLAEFNKTTNVYGKYSGLKGTGVDETGIYVKLAKIPGKGPQPFLWWAKPAAQADNFVYLGSSKLDIEDCDANYGSKSGYTWHHTGDTESDTYGTMQLVPTVEHSRLTHYGGSYLAYGYNE